MRSSRHDDRTIQESEIANGARSFFADRKGTAGVARNMIAKLDRGGGTIAQETEDLRGFAIEAFAENDIRRESDAATNHLARGVVRRRCS